MQIGRWALASGDALVLAVAAPDVPQLAHHLASAPRWVDRVGADQAALELAGAALWCVALVVAVGLCAAAAAALPGAAGRLGDRLARRVLPTAIYRLAAGATGLGVVLAPAAAAAAPAPAPPAPTAAWPTDQPLPPPSWPVTAETPAPPRGTAADHAVARVVVQPGDSLWSIAAEHLPAGASAPRIARAWPRWYGANRAVIGADPDLLRPGQVLHAPTAEDAP